jgi:hypothetical protein
VVRGLAALLAVLALASCGGGEGGEQPAALTDVGGIFELRAAFNADEGKPRLLLLLSPT